VFGRPTQILHNISNVYRNTLGGKLGASFVKRRLKPITEGFLCHWCNWSSLTYSHKMVVCECCGRHIII